MKIALNCLERSKGVLLELLAARNITVDSLADVHVVETGCEMPEEKVSIVFSMAGLGHLIELLDRLSAGCDESMDSVIGRNAHDSYEIIPLGQVYYFEARGNYVFCLTQSQEYRVKEKLYELESKLPQNQFIRVGKSYIVNINNVKEIVPWFGRRLVLRFIHSKKEIEVSKSYVKSVKDFLGM